MNLAEDRKASRWVRHSSLRIFSAYCAASCTALNRALDWRLKVEEASSAARMAVAETEIQPFGFVRQPVPRSVDLRQNAARGIAKRFDALGQGGNCLADRIGGIRRAFSNCRRLTAEFVAIVAGGFQGGIHLIGDLFRLERKAVA